MLPITDDSAENGSRSTPSKNSNYYTALFTNNYHEILLHNS